MYVVIFIWSAFFDSSIEGIAEAQIEEAETIRFQ